MRKDPLRRRAPAGLLCLIAVALVGCGAAASHSPVVSSSTRPGGSTPAPSSSAAAPSVPASSSNANMPQAWLLVGRPGGSGPQLIFSTTAAIGMELPAGAPRPAWDRIVTATPDGDSTIVRDVVVQPGFGGPEARIPGRWQLPNIGLEPVPVGRSIDGSTIALVEADPDGRTSRFAILEHHLLEVVTRAGDAPLRLLRIVELPGSFEYDAFSPNGRILYVVERLDAAAGGAYQVRAVDVATGLMRDTIIADKGNPDEQMAGSAVAQVRRTDGLVLTLYSGPGYSFIHALNSIEAWAICIDLPTSGPSTAADGLDWDLAPSPDGSAVFALNAGEGLVVDVDPDQLAVRRTATIGRTAAAPFVLAKFGHDALVSVGRRLVTAPDGSLLFGAGRDGLVAIRTSDLSVAWRDRSGLAIDGLALTPDGATLFALRRDGGRIFAVEASTGRTLGTVPGSGYDQLLAVAPG